VNLKKNNGIYTGLGNNRVLACKRARNIQQ